MVCEIQNLVIDCISVDCDEKSDENPDDQADDYADDQLRQNFDAKCFSELTANAVETFVDCKTFTQLVKNCHADVAKIHDHIY